MKNVIGKETTVQVPFRTMNKKEKKFLVLNVRILDYKSYFGGRYLVEPIAGSGKVWVQKIGKVR